MSGAAPIGLKTAHAACVLWLDGTPSYAGMTTACIGGFACDNAEAGRALLDRAAAEAARRGFQYVVGPMDGDTWHSYRLVTGGDGSPPFPFEPANPDFYADAFADFDVIARYTSARADAPQRRDVAAYGTRLRSAGVRIRTLDRNRIESDISAIYRLSLAAFANNFLYTPISEAAFMDLYRPMLNRLDPGLVLLAEADSLQAFLFAFVDRGVVVIKTCASLRPGLGGYLLEHMQAGPAAACRGVIHALMHERNISCLSSAKYAKSFRRYALYGRKL